LCQKTSAKRKRRLRDSSEKAATKRKADFSGFGYADIVEATQDVEGLTYRPRTAETREAYELILSAVHTALGDQAQDIFRSAADTVLESLKDVLLMKKSRKKKTRKIMKSGTRVMKM
jgi:pre-mRNA-splicing helicase BRR2